MSFVACVALTAWLWQRQGRQLDAVGEVEAIRIDVAVGADGLLLPLPRGEWTLFDTVQSGQVLARLDDRPLRARLEAFRQELSLAKKEVGAAEVRIALDHTDRQRDRQQEAMRLAWQAERYRLEMLDRRALIEADRIDLNRREMELKSLAPAGARAALSELAMTDRRMRRDEAARRVEQNEAALAEVGALWKAAVEARDGLVPLESPAVGQLLAPLQAAIAAQESRIRELEFEADSLEVRSPVTGTICAIHGWPGERVRNGDPIVTLAADRGGFIISYVRQDQQIRPRPGMPVAVRLRLPGARPVNTVVDRVGPQVELVPLHHRRDPAVPEWGQPVQIASPRDLSLRPGELVDVTFQIWLTERSG